MIISNKAIPTIMKVYGEQNQVTKNTNMGKKTLIQGKDEFILSAGSQEFGKVLNSIRGLDDVRQDKVNELSIKINGGTYQVSSQSIAEKMLGNYIS